MRWPWRRRSPRPAQEPPPGEDLPTDPQMVFAILGRHGVDYVTIGGIAVQGHGHVRTTRDVDIVTSNVSENLERLGAALIELRATLRGVDAHLLGIDPTDPQALLSGANFTLHTLAGPLDVWTDTDELKGSPPWAELRAGSLEAQVGGVTIRFAGREDLIAMKRAANRPKDRADIVFLTMRPGP